MINFKSFIKDNATQLRPDFFRSEGHNLQLAFFICYLLFISCLLSPLSIFAQQTFTEHLTRRIAGEGTVTLSQDAEIEALVNGVAQKLPPATVHTPIHHTQDSATQQIETEIGVQQPVTPVHRTQAVGYRIQVYAGGNDRKSKSEAYRMGGLVRSKFADVNVYTNFISPRWVCRVGDFKTREEAVEQLRKMRHTGMFGEASIVKSKIIVYY